MLYIKNGRFYTESISFDLPDELCLVSDPITVSPDTVMFETLDGKFQIMLSAYETDKTPLEELNGFLAAGLHVKMTEICDIERGAMKGKYVYYRSNSWSHEHYEERCSFPMNEEGQNAFELYIEYEVQEEFEREQVKNFMQRPNIKALLNSIKYEPDVCKSIMRSAH